MAFASDAQPGLTGPAAACSRRESSSPALLCPLPLHFLFESGSHLWATDQLLHTARRRLGVLGPGDLAWVQAGRKLLHFLDLQGAPGCKPTLGGGWREAPFPRPWEDPRPGRRGPKPAHSISGGLE